MLWMKSTGAPCGELVVRMNPLWRFSSMNSRRVFSSEGEREYITDIGGGDVPSSRVILRSYGQCGGSVTILSRSYLFSVILSLFLVLSQEHMFTMMLLNHFLISYAQHLTCCILPYASHFTMPSPLTYHMFTFCIPCCYSMDIYYIN